MLTNNKGTSQMAEFPLPPAPRIKEIKSKLNATNSIMPQLEFIIREIETQTTGKLNVEKVSVNLDKLLTSFECLIADVNVSSAEIIARLQAQVNSLQEEIAFLREENTKLNRNVEKLMNAAEYSKFHISIQDLNANDRLETIFEKNVKIQLRNLHNNRVNEYHYIYEDDDEIIINYKKKVLYIQLSNASAYIKHRIGLSLYEALITHLKPLGSVHMQEIPEVNCWWW